MQRFTILALGKTSGFYSDGIAEYCKRLRPLCKLEIQELAEELLHEKNDTPALRQQALEREGQRILALIPKSARVVCLCIEGRQQSSEEFAHMLEDFANQGASDVVFIIGSSHGLSAQVKQAAHVKLSFGKITMPHQMARLVLTEQIYRAMMIRTGSKYHK